MWILNYTREANNYALDSHPYNEDVLIAIEVLAQTDSGLPAENLWEWKPEHYIMGSRRAFCCVSANFYSAANFIYYSNSTGGVTYLRLDPASSTFAR